MDKSTHIRIKESTKKYLEKTKNKYESYDDFIKKNLKEFDRRVQ